MAKLTGRLNGYKVGNVNGLVIALGNLTRAIYNPSKGIVRVYDNFNRFYLSFRVKVLPRGKGFSLTGIKNRHYEGGKLAKYTLKGYPTLMLTNLLKKVG